MIKRIKSNNIILRNEIVKGCVYFKDGKCSLCPKGKQPNADRTDCE